MSEVAPCTLAGYASEIVELSDEWRLRVLLHEFCQLWEATEPELRANLIAEEPLPLDEHWDAFVAALAEYLAWHADTPAPDWVFKDSRYLAAYWYPAVPPGLAALRVEAAVHAPAAFDAHGILIPARELTVV